jgi:tRNA dimethylallyltransferase
MAHLVSIVGPTATGKSALAVALAERMRGEIVNADALQVYRGLDIGTAKPSDATRRLVPHHLIDILEPHEGYSAGEFARRAATVVGEIEARGNVAVVVGGSGLYQRALLGGLCTMPGVVPEVRRKLQQRLVEEGLGVLWRELQEVDAPAAGKLSAGDTQRILRALEVYAASGIPLSRWQAAAPVALLAQPALRLGLTLARPILYDRIESRLRHMVERGWVEEVAGLLSRGYEPTWPAFQAIGYRQIARALLGRCSLESALADALRATRRYAKRQLTWFSREPDTLWLDADEAPALLPEIVTRVFSFRGGQR